MSGFPYNNLAQHVSLFPSYYTIDENGHATIQTNDFMHDGALPHLPQQLGDSPTHSPTIDYDDPSQSFTSPPIGSRSRRRAAGLGEHVKFRRTRSGCYTCRNRRVKCDETRPICERCKKGGRECLYPEPTSASKTRRSSQRDKDAVSSAESDGDDFDEEILTSSVSASNDRDTTASLSPVLSDHTFLTSPLIDEARPKFPSVTSTPNRDATILSRARSMSQTAWDGLAPDVQFYLQYAKKNLTAHHWNYAPDCPEGLCNALLDAALRYEPLMYAVVCFSAYHFSLKQPDGRLEDFLTYHSKSVISLHETLKKGEKKNLATLLTILQLATIEECLGDWVNLLNHQKAAHELLTASYTPETIMRHPTLRNILMWYLHFDTFVAMLSGHPHVIAREWVAAQYDYYAGQIKIAPSNINCLLGEAASRSKLLSWDIFELFSKIQSGKLSQAEVSTELAYYADKFEQFENTLSPFVTRADCLVTKFTDTEPVDLDDMFRYEPGIVWGGDCFGTTLVLMLILGLRALFEMRLGALDGKPHTERVGQIAIRLGKMVSAIDAWADKPTGTLLTFRALISLVAFLMPSDQRAKVWAKRKFAAVEKEGYIYPRSIRAKTQAGWGEEESLWWLPEERDNVKPVIRQILEFQIEQHAAQSSATANQDDQTTNLRDMKGIFNTLSLSDASSPESVQSPGSSSNVKASSSNDKKSPAALGIRGVGEEGNSPQATSIAIPVEHGDDVVQQVDLTSEAAT